MLYLVRTHIKFPILILKIYSHVAIFFQRGVSSVVYFDGAHRTILKNISHPNPHPTLHFESIAKSSLLELHPTSAGMKSFMLGTIERGGFIDTPHVHSRFT